MRRRLVVALAAISMAGPVCVEGVVKKTPGKKQIKKKSSVKPKHAARHPPKAPPVSAKARTAAAEVVADSLERTAGVPIENPAALVPFFEQLYRSQLPDAKEPLRVLHWGDSHTASDEWTGSLRALLQNQFGDAGAGYSLAGRPFSSYRRLDVRGGGTRGWKSEGFLAREGDGLWGLGGVSVTARRPNESIYLQADCRHVELFYLQQPDGGDLEFVDNGKTVATVSTKGDLAPGFFLYDTESGPHRFELRTLEQAPVRLFGWVTEKERGITYESLGINGAQASVILKWDEALMAAHVARRNPALIVLAYGTNEASNPEWTEESYRAMFSTLLQRLRREAPTASILVLGPPDRYYRTRGSWRPFDRLDRIIDAQREAALENGCAFWDLRDKMGGPGAMKQWVTAGLAQYDHVHFTAPGYRRLGYVLYRDLMYDYQKYTKAREELAKEAPVTAQANGQKSADR